MCMLTSQKRREHLVPAGFLTNSGYARRRTANRADHTHRSNELNARSPNEQRSPQHSLPRARPAARPAVRERSEPPSARERLRCSKAAPIQRNAAQPPPHNISERARQPASSKMIEQPSARKEPCGSNSLNEQRAQSQQAACTARTNTRSPNDKRTQPETERTAARRSN